MNEFLYVNDFLSDDEEKFLIQRLREDGVPWARINKRRIKHYGLTFDYPSFSVIRDNTPPFPEYFRPFIDRLHGIIRANDINIDNLQHYFNQLTVQEYPPKSGIASHLDTTEYFGEYIALITLQSHTTMDFIHATEKTEVNKVLKKKSLALLYGDSRFTFKHGIRERKTDVVDGQVERRGNRISLTLRHALKSHPSRKEKEPIETYNM